MAFKEANDVVASERRGFNENQDYKRFLCVAMNSYIYIYMHIHVSYGI